MSPAGRFTVRSFRALAAVSLAVAPLVAQGVSAGATDPVSTAPRVQAAAPTASAAAPFSLAPRVDAVTAGVHAKATRPGPAPAAMPGKGDTARNKALMIVGGAAIIIGAIIHDNSSAAGTLFMVGGAVVGLYGLYKFLE